MTSTLVSQYFWQLPVRIDYQLSTSQSLFVRYMATKQNQLLPYKLTPSNIFSAAGNATDDLATSAVVGHTWLASANRVNPYVSRSIAWLKFTPDRGILALPT